MTKKVNVGGFEFLFILMLIPFGVLFSGYLFSIMWRWFAVESLGAPTLSTIQAIGVSMLVSWFTTSKVNRQKDSSGDKGVWQIIGEAYLNQLVFFGIAAIIHACQ